MLEPYLDEFRKQYFIGPGLVHNFEDYLETEDIPLDEDYYCITDFCDTLTVRSKTRMNYRTRLRRFVEFVYDKESIPIIEEDVLEWE